MTEAERLAKNASIKQAMKDTHAKRKMQVCRVFTCKIQYNKLSEQQKEELKMMFVEAKWIWNDILNYSNASEDAKPWNYKIGKTVNVKQKDGTFQTRELKFIQSQMKQCVQSQLCSNIKTLFSLKRKGQKVGKIKFQSECKKLHIKQLNNFKIYNGRSVKIPNIHGKVQLGGLKQFQKEYELDVMDIACAEILNTPKGYYVTFCTYTNKEYLNLKTTQKINKTIGIDFGCATSFTTSEGEKIDIKVEETDRLKKLQKERSKKKGYKKGERKSNNFKKQVLKIRREYQNISNKKKDLANKIVAKFSQYETVVIQNEQLSNWQKSNHGKAIQHSILGRVKSKLIQNPNTVILSKTAPTTKLCTKCGVWHDELKVWDRMFKCECGIEMDRDIHAAKNMIWMYENNVGVERTKLTPGSYKPPLFKRPELKALALSALNCKEKFAPMEEKYSDKSQLSTLKQEGPAALAVD